MRAEIISIGTEILIGSITNTNARYLAEKLSQNAIDVYYQVTVGDNPGRLVEAFEAAAMRSDIIIASGGLGPTEDDVTMQAVLTFLQKPAVFHKPTFNHIQKRLRLAGYKMSPLAERQCIVPKGAIIFKNIQGAAPGVLAKTTRDGKPVWILVLPGPPRELEPMFANQALPELMKQANIKREHFMVRSLKIAGMTETQVAEKVSDLLKSPPPTTLGIYAKPDLVTLKIMSKSNSEKKSKSASDKIEKIIRKRLGASIFGADKDTLSSVVGEILTQKNKTVAVAESCSGGLLGSVLTDTPGSSRYFLGGVIAYDNRVKIAELKVAPDLLKKYGAVSSQTAEKMAEGIRKKLNTDFGIGITGIAGPDGGSQKKPVGLVYIAIADTKQTHVKEMVLRGSRHEIKNRAANRALNFLRLLLVSPKSET